LDGLDDLLALLDYVELFHLVVIGLSFPDWFHTISSLLVWLCSIVLLFCLFCFAMLALFVSWICIVFYGQFDYYCVSLIYVLLVFFSVSFDF
jgi:hypothetical protein